MALYVGVDAGGTTTTYVLAEEDRELARVEGGSIKRMRVSAPVAARHLETALDELEGASGRSLAGVSRACVGAAGVTVPLVADWLAESFAKRVSGELVLVGDVEIALDAAFRGGRGVLALAGTGSNVAARTDDGRLTGAGGWGPVCDEGSGLAIGRDAVRALFQAIDAEESTVLQQRIPAFWGLAPGDLVGMVNALPPPDFSQLVPLIAAAAGEADRVSLEVLHAAGSALAATTLLAIERVRRMEGEHYAGVPDVAFAGSILRFVDPMRQSLTQTLQAAHPGITVQQTVVEPVQGALWRARRLPLTGAKLPIPAAR